MKKKIIGFPYEKYDRVEVTSLTEWHRLEWALNDEECVIFDDLETFFTDLNDNLVDTENFFFFAVNA